MGAKRIESRTIRDPETGAVLIECSVKEAPDCKGFVPVEEMSLMGGKPRGFCKRCTNARNKRYRAEGTVRVNREAMSARSKRWSEENPERRKAQRRRYMERLKADPVRYARYLETVRIAHRLRRERAGLPVGSGSRSATMAPEPVKSVPVGPLIDLVDSLVVAAGDDEYGHPMRSVREVCADIGIHERMLRYWRDGERQNVAVGTAEAIALAADVDFDLLYRFDEEEQRYEPVEVSLA